MSDKSVSDLRDTLLQLRQLYFILRVGLERKQKDKNKIDLLVGCGEEDIKCYLSQIQTLLENQWPDANLSISDDAVRFDLGIISGGIAVCDSTKLVEQIKKWIDGKNLSGQHRSWVVGYWLPEALCGDLATAEVLHDVKSVYPAIKSLVIPYPERLSQAIVAICVDEVRQKLATLGGLSQDDRTIEFALCLSDIGAAVVRLAFARSRRYLRGFRLLARQAVFLQPSDFALYELASRLLHEGGTTYILEKIRRQL